MIYRIIFDDQWFRIIPSCMIDARVGTPLAGATGVVMQKIIDEKLVLVPGNLPYKIENNNGVLVGVFVMKPDGTLIFSIIRPAFQQFEEDITQEISTFIGGNNWVYDL